TMELFRYCEHLGIHFLFSTPNAKSKKGYRRLGWDQIGTLPINMRIVRPLAFATKFIFRRQKAGDHGMADRSIVSDYLNRPDFSLLINASHSRQPGNAVTDHTPETLRWRYAAAPVGNYGACGIERENRLRSVCFYRLKQTKAGLELRIADIFMHNPSDGAELSRLLARTVATHQVDYVTCSAFEQLEIFKSGFSLRNRKIGPSVTGRSVTLPDFNLFNKFSHWNPSLGDLELF
ncbi:MAG TPA: hypothetical protein VEB86_07435, partial [Chryseosolibacter sp.]|nr:hypothetical protein [Chryseosolibacter sp.]